MTKDALHNQYRSLQEELKSISPKVSTYAKIKQQLTEVEDKLWPKDQKSK